ncbi:MAG: DNA polymerase III subunit beta [Propionibacteriaceae bacterium]|jgi:DNA polymerase-3 subunit beta|nr:DNA polymerase III subunit beta [Propionibacteriaceae bacterium]
MKVQLDRDILAESVQWAARSLPLRPSQPILAGLLIRAEPGQLILSSFDYETSARITVPATVEEPGLALVSGRLLSEISRSLPDKPVWLAADGNSLSLDCGSSHFALQLLTVADYPELPAMPQACGWIDSASLAEAVGQVVIAAGRDELLPVFTGVRLEFNHDQLSFLATDRYRMALKELVWSPAGPGLDAAVLVPGKVLAETAKSMTAGDSVTLSLASVETGEGLIGFEGEGGGGRRQITTRLLDGEFPKVRHLMNIAGQLTVKLSTSELAAAVKRVALVAERNTSLKMVIGQQSVTLEAATGDQAQAFEEVAAQVWAAEADEPAVEQVGFNPHYLSDVLSVLNAPYVKLAFSGPGKPCLLTPLADLDQESEVDYRHVIMLMRLPG